MNVEYEYQTTSFDTPVYNTVIFDAFGQDGWEMCGCVQTPTKTLYYWKRRKFGVMVDQDHDPIKTPGAFLKPEDFDPPRGSDSRIDARRDQLVPIKDGLERV